MKILIVDDDPDARNILKLIIEMQGHEAIEASDGLQGLEKTKANRPDLIISDILMPRMDGFQFLREINSDKNLSAIPFVFYSSTYTGEEEIGLAFSSGADGFIVKPKSPEKFWEELNNILSKREEEKSKKTKPIKDEEYLQKYSHIVASKLEEKVKELEKTLEERKKTEEKLFEITQDWEHTFNSITDMVTVHDKDWNIIRTNKAAEKMLGLPFLEKTSDTKCFKYYHGTEKPPEGCPSCNCLKTGESTSFEIFEPHLNMFIEIRAIPRFDSDNNLIGLIHVVRDITERKKFEEALKSSRQYARNIIDSSLDMIISVDTDRRIIEFNRAAQETFGYSPDEIKGIHVDIIYADPEEGLRLHKTTVECGRHVQEILNRRKNGEIFPSLLAASVLHDANGTLVGVMGVSRDITERKKAEEKLNQFLKDITKAKTEWEITFDNVTELIALVDKDFRIVRCNKVFAEFSDKQLNEIPGSKFTDIFPMGKEDAGYLAERIQKEEPSEWMEVTAADRWFYLSHQPVIAPDNIFLYSVVIATDITALKSSEQKLMESEGELKKRVKELEKFYEMAVGRELKMKEMKKEIKSLNDELLHFRQGRV